MIARAYITRDDEVIVQQADEPEPKNYLTLINFDSGIVNDPRVVRALGESMIRHRYAVIEEQVLKLSTCGKCKRRKAQLKKGWSHYGQRYQNARWLNPDGTVHECFKK